MCAGGKGEAWGRESSDTAPHLSFSYKAFSAIAEAERGGATASFSLVAVLLGTISSSTRASGGAGGAWWFSTSC